MRTFNNNDATIQAVALNRNGALKGAVVGDARGSAFILERKADGTWEKVYSFRHELGIRAVDFNNKQVTIVSNANRAATIKRQDNGTWVCERVVGYDPEAVLITFDNNRTLIASVPNGRVCVRERTGRVRILENDAQGNQDCIHSADYGSNINCASLDGNHAMIGLDNGTECIFYIHPATLSVLERDFINDLEQVRKDNPTGVIVLNSEQLKLFKGLPLESRKVIKQAYNLTTEQVVQGTLNHRAK